MCYHLKPLLSWGSVTYSQVNPPHSPGLVGESCCQGKKHYLLEPHFNLSQKVEIVLRRAEGNKVARRYSGRL